MNSIGAIKTFQIRIENLLLFSKAVSVRKLRECGDWVCVFLVSIAMQKVKETQIRVPVFAITINLFFGIS